MSPDKKSPNRVRKLVNDLTVEDARHLLRNEGGELTPLTIATETVSIVAVSATIAYAILQGRVTAWHLALPSLAQYFVLLAVMPLIYAATRLPGLRKDTIGALRLLVGFALIAAIAIGVRARLHEAP